MVDLAFIISVPLFLPSNVRARKITKTLSSNYRMIILEWNREKNFKSSEILSKNMIIKRFSFKAPYGSPILIFIWPFFWLWLIVNIILERPKVIYSCNLDTLIPCYISKLLFLRKTKLIFDSFDKFSLAHVSPKNKLLFKIADLIENVLTRNSDAFVTVSKDRLITYRSYIPRLVEVIPNYPEDMFQKVNNVEKMVSKKSSEELILVYTGQLNCKVGLTILKEAIKNIDGVILYLAGYVTDDVLKKLLPDPKIRYLGFLPYEKSLALRSQGDVTVVLYDPRNPISQVADPNKLYEAMMLGKPIITNVCEKIVKESKCGIFVHYNASEIREAILLLKNNPSLRTDLGTNGRLSFKKQYNWRLVEKKLLGMINQILKSDD